MADLFTARLLALYRTSPTAIPDWSTESWPEMILAPNGGEVNKFAVTAPTHFIYNLSHFGTTTAVVMIYNLNTSGFFEVQFNDGLHIISMSVPAQKLLVAPSVATSTPLEFISSGGTYDFLLALAAP